MASGSMESKGFFAALFDFGFTSFITLKFLRGIYAFFVILILFAGVIGVIAGFASGKASGVLLVVGAPILALIYLVMIRISMEMIAIFFRIGENTSIMAANSTGQAPPPTPGFGAGGFGGSSGPSYDPAPTVTPTAPAVPTA